MHDEKYMRVMQNWGLNSLVAITEFDEFGGNDLEYV